MTQLKVEVDDKGNMSYYAKQPRRDQAPQPEQTDVSMVTPSSSNAACKLEAGVMNARCARPEPSAKNSTEARLDRVEAMITALHQFMTQTQASANTLGLPDKQVNAIETPMRKVSRRKIQPTPKIAPEGVPTFAFVQLSADEMRKTGALEACPGDGNCAFHALSKALTNHDGGAPYDPKDEKCTGVPHQFDPGGSVLKQQQADAKLARCNVRKGNFHCLAFNADRTMIKCTKCGKERVRATFARWKDETCEGVKAGCRKPNT